LPIQLVVIITALFIITACGERKPPVHHEQMFTFGTLVDISIYGEEEAKAHQAIDELAIMFNQMHRDWHAWDPGPLVELNQGMMTMEPQAVPAPVLPLLLRAQELSSKTGGLFNPAIGRLVRLWGFSGHEKPAAPPPPKEEIQQFTDQAPSMDDLIITDDTVRSNNPALWLDFGAVAKGYAVDQAIEHLRSMGIENAIVNAGGDLRVTGRHGNRPWRVGIRHPRGSDILASVAVASGESIFTSGDYERYYDYEGKRFHHILDPRTGYPAQGVTSVTIIHDDAAAADAAATALFIAGIDSWQEIAKELNLNFVMLIDDKGTVHMNPEMAERIHFEVEPLPTTILSESL
jgi:thiamine biosynthesis lipoprotein